MKQKLIYLICIALSFSCSTQEDDIGNNDPEKTFDDRGSLGKDHRMTEEEATAVLMNFLDKNGETSLKSSQSPLRIISCKATDTKAISGDRELKSASSDEDGLPLYQFTISEKDDEYGFALVSGDKRFSEVLAYAPKGNIADTIYNEGLADFMRSLSTITTTAIGNEYWQPQDVPGITFIVPGSYQFLKYATEQEYWDWPFYGDWDYIENPCAFVPVKWDQEHPYNMYAPIPNTPYNHCTTKSRVGCAPVAIAQLMAFHKRHSYDWNTLTRTEQITSSSTAYTQAEVARLIIDLAKSMKTEHKCLADRSTAGGTYPNYIYNALCDLNYSFCWNNPRTKVSSDTIYANMIRNQPVLCSVPNTDYHNGHIFIIDGLYRRYRNKYSFSKDISDPNNKIFEIYKARECFACMHINWGWGGSSDGWYYSFTPYGKPYSWFDSNKTLITNIKYTGE